MSNDPQTNLPIVVAFTGASGAAYGLRLIQVLTAAGCDVHLTISPAAERVFREELDLTMTANNVGEILTSLMTADGSSLVGEIWRGARPVASPQAGSLCHERGRIVAHPHTDYGCSIASGSFRTRGMVICPCSLGTLAAIASGVSTNLVQRAADVHLKERRKLILVPRETPLSRIHLQNMLQLTDAGALILPAMPGFYHRPRSLMDLIDFVITRICDHLDVPIRLTSRWMGDGPK